MQKEGNATKIKTRISTNQKRIATNLFAVISRLWRDPAETKSQAGRLQFVIIRVLEIAVFATEKGKFQEGLQAAGTRRVFQFL